MQRSFARRNRLIRIKEFFARRLGEKSLELKVVQNQLLCKGHHLQLERKVELSNDENIVRGICGDRPTVGKAIDNVLRKVIFSDAINVVVIFDAHKLVLLAQNTGRSLVLVIETNEAAERDGILFGLVERRHLRGKCIVKLFRDKVLGLALHVRFNVRHQSFGGLLGSLKLQETLVGKRGPDLRALVLRCKDFVHELAWIRK